MGFTGRTEQRAITSLQIPPLYSHRLLPCMYHQARHPGSLLGLPTQSIYVIAVLTKVTVILCPFFFFFSYSTSFLNLLLTSLAQRVNQFIFLTLQLKTKSQQQLNFWVIFKRATCFKVVNVFVNFYFKKCCISSPVIRSVLIIFFSNFLEAVHRSPVHSDLQTKKKTPFV